MSIQEDIEKLGQQIKDIIDKETVLNILLDNEIARYPRGSVVYGTFEGGISDYDWLVVVDNAFASFLDKFPKGIYQDTKDNNDYEFITEHNFIQRLANNEIDMLECVFSRPETCDGKYKKVVDDYFDKWKLRQSISSICSNSWVKCKKKLTVEKDYNLRIAQKSLWHSLRLYMFGIQIARNGMIVDWGQANGLWKQIRNADTPTWDYYKAEYQDMFNHLRSEFVKLCEKPKEI